MLANWLLSTSIGDGLPTSINRTCIAVIDETSFGIDFMSNTTGSGTLADPWRIPEATITAAREAMRQKWLTFRENYPNRYFFLLQPGGGRDHTGDWYGVNNLDENGDPIIAEMTYTNGSTYDYREVQIQFGFYDLMIPQEFLDDPKAFYIPVDRQLVNHIDMTQDPPEGFANTNYQKMGASGATQGYPATRYTDDWAEACGLDTIPNLGAVALFIDISGSLVVDDVRDSYDALVAYLQNRGMAEIKVNAVANNAEDWIGCFDKILASEDAQQPGQWTLI